MLLLFAFHYFAYYALKVALLFSIVFFLITLNLYTELYFLEVLFRLVTPWPVFRPLLGVSPGNLNHSIFFASL